MRCEICGEINVSDMRCAKRRVCFKCIDDLIDTYFYERVGKRGIKNERKRTEPERTSA